MARDASPGAEGGDGGARGRIERELDYSRNQRPLSSGLRTNETLLVNVN